MIFKLASMRANFYCKRGFLVIYVCMFDVSSLPFPTPPPSRDYIVATSRDYIVNEHFYLFQEIEQSLAAVLQFQSVSWILRFVELRNERDDFKFRVGRSRRSGG